MRRGARGARQLKHAKGITWFLSPSTPSLQGCGVTTGEPELEAAGGV